MILKLIAMIILGILSGILSYYNKNYYVRVFDDILGREQEDSVPARVGRGFWYGFLFPIYFVLLLTGLIFLIAFLIVAGIIAAIVFAMVWITEKILPNESVGEFLRGLFEKVGLRGAIPSQRQESPAFDSVASEAPQNTTPAPPAPGPESGPEPEAEKEPGNETPKA